MCFSSKRNRYWFKPNENLGFHTTGDSTLCMRTYNHDYVSDMLSRLKIWNTRWRNCWSCGFSCRWMFWWRWTLWFRFDTGWTGLTSFRKRRSTRRSGTTRCRGQFWWHCLATLQGLVPSETKVCIRKSINMQMTRSNKRIMDQWIINDRWMDKWMIQDRNKRRSGKMGW